MADARAGRRGSGLGRLALGMAGKRGRGPGRGLSWINFRWLKGSVQAFGTAATAQAGSQQVRVPVLRLR